MKIIVRNQAGISNKYIRFIKWKIYGMKEKFRHLMHAEVSVRTEGSRPVCYQVHARLGIPGSEIILKDKSENLWELLYKMDRNARRHLSNNKVFVTVEIP